MEECLYRIMKFEQDIQVGGSISAFEISWITDYFTLMSKAMRAMHLPLDQKQP